MTEPLKQYQVTLEVSLTVTVPVRARDSEEARHIARWQWRDQIGYARAAGFDIMHDTIHVAQPQEVQS